MPIYDQTFRRYAGARSTRFLWWVVARQTLRPILKAKGTYLLLSFVVIPVIIFSIGFFIAAQVEKMAPQHASGMSEVSQATKIPIFGKNIPASNGIFEFLRMESAFVVLIILAHGGVTITTDKRNSALPLYFSRPLRKRSYVLGKIVGLGIVPFVVLGASVCILFAQVVGYWYTPLVALQMVPMLLRAMAYIALLALFTSTSMVSFSSASRNSNVAGIAFVVFWMLALVIGGAAREELGRTSGIAAVSPTLSFEVIARHLIRPDVDKLMRRAQSFELRYAVLSVFVYMGLFLYVIRRNLKVVEVVR